MTKRLKKLSFSTRFTFLYITISCVWILASDRLVLLLVSDPNTESTISTFKGWGFVVVTGLLVYFLIEKETKKRKLIEKELEFQAKKAKESEELKTQFLANMSHEIRTPLNGIIGFSQLLKNTNLTKEQRQQYIEIVDYSSDQLLMLINDILDISLIEADQMTIYREAFNLNAMIDEIYELFSLYKSKKNKGHLEINKTKYLCNDDAMIFTDPKRLRQIYYNLLNNAIKYTNEGSIEFGYKLTNNGNISFFVKDTGIGISEANHKIIFQRFRRLEKTNSFNESGTGLGLAICKALIEKLEGEIHVKSKIGIGSTFYFELPCKIPSKTENQYL